jgi:hypothetical protein
LLHSFFGILGALNSEHHIYLASVLPLELYL